MEQTHALLAQSKRQYEKFHRSSVTAVQDHRVRALRRGAFVSHRHAQAASDSLALFGAMMKDQPEFAVLGEFTDKVVQFSMKLQVRERYGVLFWPQDLFPSILQEFSTALHRDLQAHLLTPLDGVLEGDLAEAEFSKKRFNKVRVPR